MTAECPALRALILPVSAPLAQLLAGIRHCIEADDARILDRASEKLGSLREARRANLQALRRGMDEWSRTLHSQGVSERPQVGGGRTLAPHQDLKVEISEGPQVGEDEALWHLIKP